jgi:hypothetical protein
VQTTYQGYDLTTPRESLASSEDEEEKHGLNRRGERELGAQADEDHMRRDHDLTHGAYNQYIHNILSYHLPFNSLN